MQFDDEAELAVKCDLCVARLDSGESPACSKVCPTQCIFWGDTKKLHDKIDAEIQ
jgi:Fe-S-cluster-containing dehydrogenase component